MLIRLTGKKKQVFGYWELIVKKYGHRTLGELAREVVKKER